jgi:hypothetical protein
MGASSSAVYSEFSSDEKAEISRLLQSKYLTLQEQNPNTNSNDAVLFEALQR